MQPSTAKRRVLLIDDELGWIKLLAARLSRAGFEVEVCRKGWDGLELARSFQPHLILLDVELPDVDGLTLCREFRRDPATRLTWIMILTGGRNEALGMVAGADDYVTKTVDLNTIEDRILSLLWRPPRTTEGKSILSLSCVHNEPITIHSEGVVDIHARSAQNLDLDPLVFGRRGRNALNSHDWLFESRDLGDQIYDRLFVRHHEVGYSYAFLCGWVKSAEGIRLRIECRRGQMAVPYEFLFFRGADTEGFHMALQHPMARRIAGVACHKSPLSPEFFGHLSARDEPLKILLIASNTVPSIPAVDEEIQLLSRKLPGLFQEAQDIRTKVTVVPTGNSTIETAQHSCVIASTTLCITRDTEISSRTRRTRVACGLRQSPGRQGAQVNLTVAQLENLLTGSDTRFVYLSCCYGTAGAEEHAPFGRRFSWGRGWNRARAHPIRAGFQDCRVRRRSVAPGDGFLFCLGRVSRTRSRAPQGPARGLRKQFKGSGLVVTDARFSQN